MSEFDINNFISDCFDLHEKAKKQLEDYNTIVNEYKIKYNQIFDYLKEHNDVETLGHTSQILVDLKPINIENTIEPLPKDMELITYNDLDESITEITKEEIDETEVDDMSDIKKDYDDFNIISSRDNKGTGKNNYTSVYNTKYIRKVSEGILK